MQFGGDPVAKGHGTPDVVSCGDGGCVCLSFLWCHLVVVCPLSPCMVPRESRRGASSTASRRCVWATASRPSTTRPLWAAGTTRWRGCCGSCPGLSPSPSAWCSPKRLLVSCGGPPALALGDPVGWPVPVILLPCSPLHSNQVPPRAKHPPCAPLPYTSTLCVPPVLGHPCMAPMWALSGGFQHLLVLPCPVCAVLGTHERPVTGCIPPKGVPYTLTVCEHPHPTQGSPWGWVLAGVGASGAGGARPCLCPHPGVQT